MESSKQQCSQKTKKRRDRAARMHRQKQAAAHGRANSKGGAEDDLSENEDTPVLRREKRPPPPTRKKRNKDPLFQEDIIDGFAFLCFKTYEDLEKTVNKLSSKPAAGDVTTPPTEGVGTNQENSKTPSLIDESLPQLEKQKTTPIRKPKINSPHRIKKKNLLISKVNNRSLLKATCLSSTNDEITRPGDDDRQAERHHHQKQPPRTASRDQLSDVSSHASLERGYMCDSESGDERGSEPECDLFSSKNDSNYIAKKNNPGHSHHCRSPPVLPPIHPMVQNGTHHHPEPSTAVAAVTASASPANTVSAMVVGSASPREPQIGSPAVLPIACNSPASPPAGVVPPSQPPFLQKGPSPATVPQQNKDDPSSSQLIGNGYEPVSDTSPPSPLAKMLSPSKFLHKRTLPIGSCRETVTVPTKPAINVYDFVSDHSAPSSPDGVIFLSQLKSHHKSSSLQTTNKPMTADKVSVSNSHGGGVTAIMPSSPAIPLATPLTQNSHKSALDMSVKSSTTVKPSLTVGPTPVSVSEHRHPLPPQLQVRQVQQQQPLQQQHPPHQQQQQQQIQSHQQSRSSSYNIPYSTSQPPPRKMSSPPRMSPHPLPMSLSSPVLSSASSISTAPSLPVSTRTYVTTTSTTLSSGPSYGVIGQRCSPVVTTSHPNTPTPVPPRDSHSSHSNSSLSSLSQISTPVHSKDSREGGTSRSHSNSSNHTPSNSSAANTTTAYTATSSLASLVFSKPHSWGSTSGPTHTTAASRVSPLTTRSTPPHSSSLPLPPTLPPAHHTPPFGSHPGPPPPPLLPVVSHHGIFAPGSLTPTMPLDSTAGPSPYRAETLYPQPNPDLLRRELDTRFLASQDHSIPIPPPPYMQAEVHQHGSLHQQPSYMGPPSLGAPLVTQPTAHLYEKYPKLDSSLYGRPSIGLSSYPPVSAIFAPGGGASTPFAPPAHLTALQPKINSVPKAKSLKPGKWCAMHVRIAWEIYNHQQKQKRAEAHKAGIALAAAAKPQADPLHPSNHLFSLPRQHDLAFSSSLLNAAASAHPRPFDAAASHHSTFLNPTPAHLGPFSRPGYPGFAAHGPSFSSLGPLGLPGSSVLGPELRGGGCLTQDPWTQQRTALSFAASSAPWGGLKEEAERDRLQQEHRKREEERKRAEMERREKEERERREQERREQERREMERREQERKEQERKERERKEQERREMERREMERREQERREQERREQERQKERDRELRHQHQLQKNSAIVMNGDISDHHLHHHPAHPQFAWERVREQQLHHHQQHSRSPVQPMAASVKYETALDRHALYNARMEAKVKQEHKDDDSSQSSSRSSGLQRTSSGLSDDRHRPKGPGGIPQQLEQQEDVMHSSRGNLIPAHSSVGLGLGTLDPTRGPPHHGLVQSPAKDHPLSQTSPLWGPLTPSPTVSGLSAGTVVDPYRTRDILQGRAPPPEPDRRYVDPLASVMSSSPRDRCAATELSRQISSTIDLERQLLEREHAAAVAAAAYDRVKLLPPPLRTNESPYMTPPTLPPASASSFFSPPVSPYLNMCTAASSRAKPGAPTVMNGLPPPLIPCTFPVQNHAGFPGNRTSSPMAHKLVAVSTAGVLNLHESFFPKERREVNGHPSDLEAHLRL